MKLNLKVHVFMRSRTGHNSFRHADIHIFSFHTLTFMSFVSTFYVSIIFTGTESSLLKQEVAPKPGSTCTRLREKFLLFYCFKRTHDDKDILQYVKKIFNVIVILT